MSAWLVLRERFAVGEGVFVEMVVWRVASPVDGSAHDFKYRLALIRDETCVLRYDNEAGKGDHKHLGRREAPYRFVDLDTLQSDFWEDVATCLREP